MKCYLIRHGKDDDSVRGGWSNSSLTDEGVMQVNKLVCEILTSDNMNIGSVYTSDLLRARQTADILASALSVPIVEKTNFREVNNGVLAGMDNRLAEEKYPGLYWRSLDWAESYPEGESPCEFYERIADAWNKFKTELQNAERNVILVTHGGVINAIQCIEHQIAYSNKVNPFPIGNAEMLCIEF